MEDRELIQAMRVCEEMPGCAGCVFDGDCFNRAADRLEALMAENDLLYREVAKLKAECDHFRDLTKKLWCEKRYMEGTNSPTGQKG